MTDLDKLLDRMLGYDPQSAGFRPYDGHPGQETPDGSQDGELISRGLRVSHGDGNPSWFPWGKNMAVMLGELAPRFAENEQQAANAVRFVRDVAVATALYCIAGGGEHWDWRAIEQRLG